MKMNYLKGIIALLLLSYSTAHSFNNDERKVTANINYMIGDNLTVLKNCYVVLDDNNTAPIYDISKRQFNLTLDCQNIFADGFE